MAMKRLPAALGLVLALGGVAGCGGGSRGPTQPLSTPPRPEIGQQIDRAGRAGINHVATDPFGLMELYSHQIQDTYNRASDRARWNEQLASRLRFSLSVWDGVDGVCGNQLAAASKVDERRYDALVSLFVDDVLLVDSDHGKCDTYLAVEQRILGVGPAQDCGGRHPLMDTPDITMSYFAAGLDGRTAEGAWSLSDGISSDADGAVSLTELPFLLPAGSGSPQSATPGAIAPMQVALACATLGETRCNRVYACWGRSAIPDAYRDVYNYRVDDCIRQHSAECHGVSTAHRGPRCPSGMILDLERLRACERLYSLATCAEIQSAGAGLLACGDLCVPG